MLLMMKRLGLLEKLDLKKARGLNKDHIVRVIGDYDKVLNWHLRSSSDYQRFLDALPEDVMMEFFVSLKPVEERPDELTYGRWHWEKDTERHQG